MSKHPFLSTDFLVNWSALSPDQARLDIRLAITQAQSAIEVICQLKHADASYENSFAALEEAPMPLMRAWQRLNHLRSVSDTPELRELINELMPEVVTFSSMLTLNPRLYALLESAAAADWVAELSPVKQRFITETLEDFRESGAELNDEQKTRYTEISMRLAELSQSFGERVLDATNAWEYVTSNEAELIGLPDSAKAAALQDARSKGLGSDEAPQWRFSLQQPSLVPVLTYAEDASLRERVWRAFGSRGTAGFDTSALVHEILELRQQKAALLGYACYSDYALSRRMAGSGARALGFIDDMHDKLEDAFRKEQEDIRIFAQQETGESIELMQPWSISFWSERYRKALYDFDGELLRPYFPMKSVLDGMFALYSDLFGFNITQREVCYREEANSPMPEGAVEVWHPDVLFYDLHDSDTGEHMGSFYADWYPRETKRAGAWMDCLACGLPPMGDSPRKPHLGLMCGNMSKPLGDQPAQLTHSEVETVFHEFGHLIHQLLSEVEVRSLSGTNVAWDFVELPSQIHENWCWEPEALQRFALHWESNEPLPEDLMERMLAARKCGAASFAMRQLSFAKIDLELHAHTESYLNRNLEEIDREVLASYRIPLSDKAPSMLRAFSHIFDGGYESGYYSYKWAEMLEADAFSRFAKEGIFNPTTGRDFRRCILSAGNSRPAAELYRNFMQRDPDPEALLKRSL